MYFVHVRYVEYDIRRQGYILQKDILVAVNLQALVNPVLYDFSVHPYI